MSRTRMKLLFMNPADETQFFSWLRQARPTVRLVAGSQWATPEPPVVYGPHETDEPILFLWDPIVRTELPFRLRGLTFDGPKAGYVVQWVRSRVDSEDELRSGSLTAGWDPTDSEMTRFVGHVWSSLRSCTTSRLTRLDGSVDQLYCVGKSTRLAAVQGTVRLTDASVPVYFEATP